ncbi:MAG: Outer membrane porin protein [Herbaspirillum frisingense]|uniref:Outer membrane porin protein n=1 Tax=Herbaspirillum frisingense TaxID=92645 RepID=A0A7V8JTT6_9BURK|nr:MAG: Outer membrane porin protein [Herbaspirillum frisingense]
MNAFHRLGAAGCLAAACFALPSLGFAQSQMSSSSVKLYGIVDTGVEYLTNAANVNGKPANLTRMTSGNMSGSRWGITGNEDLGGGSSSFFLLESGMAVDTGGMLQGNRLFGRLSYVGLSDTDYGSVSVGRIGGLFLDWVSKFNPLNNAVYAVKMMDPAFSDRFDKTIRYQKKFGTLTTVVQYSMGYDNVAYGAQPAGDNLKGRVMEAGLLYENGDFGATLVYDQKNGQTTNPAAATTTAVGGYEGNTDKRLGLAMSYKMGEIDLFGGYRYLNSKAIHLTALTKGPVQASSLVWLGTTYHMTPRLLWSGTAMYQNFYGSNLAPMSFQVDVDYFLSKRTDLYINTGYVINRGGADLGLNGFASSVVAGHNQFGTQIGIRHTF